MTVDEAARAPRPPTDVGTELPLWRLHLMRVGYLLMGLGLAVVKWPVVIGYDRSTPLFEGIVAVILLTAAGLALVILLRHDLDAGVIAVAFAILSVGVGTAEVASGGVLALLGGLCFLTGLVLLAGDQWLRDRYWLAALIVTLIAGGVAAWFAKRGAALLSPSQLAPTETVATLKEDKEWLKRQLT